MMENNDPKKMDVTQDLHRKICKLQTELYDEFDVKINIQDITNMSIEQGLPMAKHILSTQLIERLK